MNPLPPAADPAGLRAITLYKAVKGSVELVLAAGCLVILFGAGLDSALDLAQSLREHLVSGWSTRLADWTLSAATPRHVKITGLALACDGAMTLGEWWCLRERHPWGEWLVVASSGSLLPFEVFELIRGVRLGRVVVFVLNLAIVAYLAARRLKKTAIPAD